MFSIFWFYQYMVELCWEKYWPCTVMGMNEGENESDISKLKHVNQTSVKSLTYKILLSIKTWMA